MKKVFKELFKDWKTWGVLGCGLLNIVLSLYEKDWTEVMWCFIATTLYFVGSILSIVMQAASEHIEKQENAIMKAGVIMDTQAAIIKELNDKLDGRKDNADSGAGVVAEEALQAHEE